MKTRSRTITVTEMDSLPSTGRECSNCEDGEYVRDGYELICTTCQYTPTKSTSLRKRDEWDKHRAQVESRASGERDGRPRLVGGYEDAYWGSGEYEYDPREGFQL
jgi:hypothetical protein